jgi:hypothetical protein
MNDILKAALWYASKGFSVIPIRAGEKKPHIKWEPYQHQRATDAEIRNWWQKWPDANVGVVTGQVSGIDVIDVDSEAGKAALDEFMPDTIVAPACRTPSGGWHFYFAHRPGLVNRARVLTDCDVRTCGGYVVAPPSQNGNGRTYTWIPRLKINEVAPPAMPDFLHDILSQGGPPPSGPPHCSNNNSTNTRGEALEGTVTKPQQSVTNHNIRFEQGQRDEALFSLAYHLAKGGMPEANIRYCVNFVASNCSPPFPEKEVEAKIQSALKRAKTRGVNLTEAIRAWVSVTWGNISVTECVQSVTNRNIGPEDRAKVRVILGRLVKEGILERVPDKNGWFRKVDAECDAVDFLSASPDPVKLWLPCDLNQKVEILPGNIIVVAGSPNAGKTALLLNIVRRNMADYEVNYFNSEMGAGELRKRLMAFDDILLKDWRFKAWERSSNFADVIRSGEGKLNIIDFLEISDNFYQVSGMLTEIHKRLKGAVAVVALQKNRGADLGLGGARSLEKPRLYLSMDSGVLKIQKAKNWASAENPNGMQYTFKLVGGHKFVKVRDWHRPDPS